MKLEVGKYYVLVSGQIVGPMFAEVGEEETVYMSNDVVDCYMPIWKENGKADFFSNPESNYPEHDILKEFDESF